MRESTYEVVFVDKEGIHQRSRIFSKLSAARTWGKWLCKQTFTLNVLIYKGCAGGEIIDQFAA